VEKVATEYEPQLSGEDPTRVYIVNLDGRRIGMTQTYRWADNEPEANEIGALPGEAGIDYFIGELDLIGQGVGAIVLARFLREIVFADADVTGVRVPIDIENRRSWRCLEKLGFERGEAIPRHGGEVQYVPSLARYQFFAQDGRAAISFSPTEVFRDINPQSGGAG
jgi:RimJ/RimL family protein N-acetyltransferase